FSLSLFTQINGLSLEGLILNKSLKIGEGYIIVFPYIKTLDPTSSFVKQTPVLSKNSSSIINNSFLSEIHVETSPPIFKDFVIDKSLTSTLLFTNFAVSVKTIPSLLPIGYQITPPIMYISSGTFFSKIPFK